MESEASLSTDTFNLGITLVMILLNGFFVAAEFALVKLNQGKVNIMVKEEKPFASISFMDI